MPFLALDPAAAAPAPATTLGVPLQNVGMTLAEFRGRLNLQLGGRPDVTTPMLDQWINAAYIDICSSLEIEELKGTLTLNLVAGQALYTLPKTVRAITLASVIDAVTYGEVGGRQLTLTDLAKYRRSSERADEPEEYFRVGELFVIWPTPTSVRDLSLDVWVRPAKMTADDHSPIIPEEWHEIILRNARQMAHSDLREWSSAAIAQNEFVGMVRRKTDTEELEEDNKVIGSSVPKDRRQIYRRNARTREDTDGLR